MPARTLQIPEGFTSTITPIMEHNIHALEAGNKHSRQTIVLIHGALASRRYLIPTATLLANAMRVYVPEMPGHGASSKPRHALTVNQQANVLSEWMQKKELKNVHIFANSYGCQVAAQLIVNNPELPASLILSDPTTDPRARSLITEAYRFYINGFFEPKGAGSQLLEDLSDMGIVIAFETVQQMIRDDIRPKLQHIKCRTLVLRGEKDPIAPQRWTKEVARLIPHARFHVIPNAPHCVNYATPLQLTSAILDFINTP